MPYYLPVAGTWGFDRDNAGEWWLPGSTFHKFMGEHGFTQLGGEHPFVWSTNLNGLWLPWANKRRHADWMAAGHALRAYLYNPVVGASIPLRDRNIIAHSHGLQVALYAASYGLQINRLVSVGSPVRKDMLNVAKAARPNIRFWTHIHSDGSDKMQWFGELFDGSFGIRRSHPLADLNVKVPHASHSLILRDPAHIALWETEGWLGLLHA